MKDRGLTQFFIYLWTAWLVTSAITFQSFISFKNSNETEGKKKQRSCHPRREKKAVGNHGLWLGPGRTHGHVIRGPTLGAGGKGSLSGSVCVILVQFLQRRKENLRSEKVSISLCHTAVPGQQFPDSYPGSSSILSLPPTSVQEPLCWENKG